MPKENIHYTCIACITIDSFMKIGEKNPPQVYLGECKYRVKKIKMSKFINTERKPDWDWDWDLDSEKVGTKFNAELMTKLKSSSDSEKDFIFCFYILFFIKVVYFSGSHFFQCKPLTHSF